MWRRVCTECVEEGDSFRTGAGVDFERLVEIPRLVEVNGAFVGNFDFSKADLPSRVLTGLTNFVEEYH